MKKYLAGAVAVAMMTFATGGGAVTFGHVCTSAAACDNDADFAFTITLEDSVVSNNGTYDTTDDDGAGFLGWSAESSVGDGFSISGGFAEIVGGTRLIFEFDDLGVLSGILEAGGGVSFTFLNAGVGRVGFLEPGNFNHRTDFDPSGVIDHTDIMANWALVADVPLPASLPLLLVGLFAFVATRTGRARGGALPS